MSQRKAYARQREETSPANCKKTEAENGKISERRDDCSISASLTPVSRTRKVDVCMYVLSHNSSC